MVYDLKEMSYHFHLDILLQGMEPVGRCRWFTPQSNVLIRYPGLYMRPGLYLLIGQMTTGLALFETGPLFVNRPDDHWSSSI